MPEAAPLALLRHLPSWNTPRTCCPPLPSFGSSSRGCSQGQLLRRGATLRSSDGGGGGSSAAAAAPRVGSHAAAQVLLEAIAGRALQREPQARECSTRSLASRSAAGAGRREPAQGGFQPGSQRGRRAPGTQPQAAGRAKRWAAPVRGRGVRVSVGWLRGHMALSSCFEEQAVGLHVR